LCRITHRTLFLANCIKNYSTTSLVRETQGWCLSSTCAYTRVFVLWVSQEISEFCELHAHRRHMHVALYAHIIITSSALVPAGCRYINNVSSVLKRILVFTRLQTTAMNFTGRRAQMSFPSVILPLCIVN